MDKIIVKTNRNGVRTVSARDIIQSKKGKLGLAKTKALFDRVTKQGDG